MDAGGGGVTDKRPRRSAAGGDRPSVKAGALVAPVAPGGVVGGGVRAYRGRGGDRIAKGVGDVDDMVIPAPLGGPGGGIKFVAPDGGINAHAAVRHQEVLTVELSIHDKGRAGGGGPGGSAGVVRGSPVREGVVHGRGPGGDRVGVGEFRGTAGHGKTLGRASAHRGDVDGHRRSVGEGTLVGAIGDGHDLVSAGHGERGRGEGSDRCRRHARGIVNIISIDIAADAEPADELL